MMKERLFSPATDIANKFWTGISHVVGAVLIFLFGWIIAKLLRLMIVRFFRAIKLDKIVEDSGFKDFLDKGSVGLTVSEMLGIGVYWLVMLVVIFVAINFAGVSIPSDIIDNLLSFIPKFILGLLIFIFSMFVGNLFGEIVRTSAANAGVGRAALLGKITQAAITAFGVVVALQEIGIAAEFIGNVFIVVLSAFCFGLALAFALGSKDIIRKWLEEVTQKKP